MATAPERQDIQAASVILRASCKGFISAVRKVICIFFRNNIHEYDLMLSLPQYVVVVRPTSH